MTEAGDFVFLRLAQRSFLLRREGPFQHMQFTGDDFFKDKDVCSIVLELPNSELGNKSGNLGAHSGED